MTKLTEKQIRDILIIDYPDLKKVKFVKDLSLYIFKSSISLQEEVGFKNTLGKNVMLKVPCLKKKEIHYVHAICIDAHLPKRDFTAVLIHELFHYACTSLGDKLIGDIAKEEAIAYQLENLVSMVLEDSVISKG